MVNQVVWSNIILRIKVFKWRPFSLTSHRSVIVTIVLIIYRLTVWEDPRRTNQLKSTQDIVSRTWYLEVQDIINIRAGGRNNSRGRLIWHPIEQWRHIYGINCTGVIVSKHRIRNPNITAQNNLKLTQRIIWRTFISYDVILQVNCFTATRWRKFGGKRCWQCVKIICFSGLYWRWFSN